MDAEVRQHFVEGVDTSYRRGIRAGATKEQHGAKKHVETPWTATRCHRLLRPLISQISTLRHYSGRSSKLRLSDQNQDSSAKEPLENTAKDESGHRSQSTRFDPDISIAIDSPKHDDPDWIPGLAKLPASKTYGGRIKPTKATKPDRSTGAEFRTPFIQRILNADSNLSPSHDPMPSYRGMDSMFGLPPRRMRQLPVLPVNSRDKAVKGSLVAFSTLLANTAAGKQPNMTGARSLLQTCLRKIPAYIKWEARWVEDNQKDAEDSHVVNETYDYLEDFGTSANGGWSALRQVVRAHALDLVLDAISDRLFPNDPVVDLLEICANHTAFAEAQAILRTWFLTTRYWEPDRLDKFMRCCRQRSYVGPYYRGFLFRTLRESLERAAPLGTELHQNSAIWHEMLKALAKESERGDAALFLHAYVSFCITDPSCTASDLRHKLSERTRMLRTGLVLVTALGWSDNISREKAKHPTRELGHCIHRIAISAYQSTIQPAIQDNSDSTGKVSIAARIVESLLMGSLILRTIEFNNNRKADPVQLKTTSEALDSVLKISLSNVDFHKTISARADFLCKVARYVGHARKEYAQEFLQETVLGLLEASRHCSGVASTAMRNLAVDSSVTWAEHRGDNACFTFAEEVEHSASAGDSCRTTTPSRTSTKRPQFRWEEGLCEWIEATPLVPKRKCSKNGKRSAMQALGLDNESNNNINHAKIARVLSSKHVNSTMLRRHISDDDRDELSTVTPMVNRMKLPQQDSKLGSRPQQYRHKPRLSRSQSSADYSSEDELVM